MLSAIIKHYWLSHIKAADLYVWHYTLHFIFSLYHKMGERVERLQDGVYTANTKIDRILNKLDAIQQIQMTSESSESEVVHMDSS